MARYTLDDLAQMVDHTNLKPYATDDDMRRLCAEARQYHFRMVAVNQVQSRLCAQELAGSDVHVGAAISFPLGQTSIAVKAFETQDAIANGATEIDYVINLTRAKAHDWNYIEDEMKQIVSICKDAGLISKVIFENCYLSDEEKVALCGIAQEVEPTFVKTSTGFGTSGATVEDVRLMKANVGDVVQVKAAGGIRDADTFLEMVQAGATRIGCSAGIPIMQEFERRLETMENGYFEL
ncbi:deoxyribose-phosphate aldolase [Olsenella profusa]|uniref:Deoxyribose-phosphate aldolase n=1 Tax=Olsenella profusa F0195 TaxID=1125712 RepID=U2TPR1_9ACTN|nr:deoxyribose-phosphate aldolase [Olsenella profusa]ERL08103.1 deoxyribose-phosphate aldolase [Olsenella profusa F0195]